MQKGQYIPVSDDDEEIGPTDKSIEWNSSSEIIPTNTKGFIAYLSILLISLSANIILLLHHFPPICTGDTGRSIYSGLTFDTLVPYRTQSDYWNRQESNLTTANAAWDAINTDPMAIALHDDFAKQVGLSPSTRFPWDTERSVYYLKGSTTYTVWYVDPIILCSNYCAYDIEQKLIRHGIVTGDYGGNRTLTLTHLLHCLDGLRQDVMCIADDTPMPALIAHHVGDGQVRHCRDWNKMAEWATRLDQHACHSFDDYREATNTLELFAFCPSDSPYRPVMEAYFEYHGHKDPYEVKYEGAHQVS